MTTIDIRFSPRIYLPKIQTRRQGFHSVPRIYSKGFNFARIVERHRRRFFAAGRLVPIELREELGIVTLSQLVFHRLDDESYMFERRPQLLHRLQVLLGARAAEEVVYGRDTSRASVDYLADASWLARKILTIWNLENPMCMHGEPPPWRKKVKFIGPRMDFEGSLYDDYRLIEPPFNFNLDDEIAQRTEELIRDMYERTLSLLQRHHAALLKTVKVLLDQKEISGEEIDFILDKYPPQTSISLLLKEDDPGCLPFVRQDEGREIEYALITQSKEETR